jgi:hypothetical protein
MILGGECSPSSSSKSAIWEDIVIMIRYRAQQIYIAADIVSNPGDRGR